MQRRLQEDELRVLRGEAEVDEAHVDDDSAVSEDAPSDTGQGAQTAPAGFVTAGRGPSFGGGGEARTTTRGERGGSCWRLGLREVGWGSLPWGWGRFG